YPNIDQTGLYVNGAVDDAGIDLRPSGIDLDGSENTTTPNIGAVYHVTVAYNAQTQTLTQTITDTTDATKTFTIDYQVNIPGILGSGKGYFGFTGATGGLNANQSIINFHLNAVETFNAPSNVQALSDAPTDVHVSWVDTSNSEDGYTIERASSAAGPF